MKTYMQYVFFGSGRATSASHPVKTTGFYIDQQLAAQTKAFTYLLWFLLSPFDYRKNPTLWLLPLQALFRLSRY